jgi:hypothetical protein
MNREKLYYFSAFFSLSRQKKKFTLSTLPHPPKYPNLPRFPKSNEKKVVFLKKFPALVKKFFLKMVLLGFIFLSRPVLAVTPPRNDNQRPFLEETPVAQSVSGNHYSVARRTHA